MKLDELIKSFCSTDDLKPKFNNPVYDDGNIIATNGHFLLIAHEKHFDKKYNQATTENFVNYKNVIPYFDNPVLFEIDNYDLRKAIAELPKTNPKCDRCDGEGVVFGYEDDEKKCKDCNGTGLSKELYIPDTYHNFNYPYGYIAKISFPGSIAYFNINYIETLSKLADLAGENIKWFVFAPLKMNVLYVSDVMIVFMPVDHTPTEHVKEIELSAIIKTITHARNNSNRVWVMPNVCV